MPNISISDLPAAGPIDGDELVPIVQNGITVRTTTSAVAGAPDQQQTFITKNQEPTLPNSRALSGGTGIGLTDGGAQSTLQITLNGASGSLESMGNGMVAKTGSNTVAARSIAVSGDGLSITNGSGVSGNPTVSLDGLAGALASVGGTGLVAVQGGTTAGTVLVAGTANQIDVANGNGSGGNPTLSITANPVIPGTGAMKIPVGTTAQEPAGVDGQIRFNSDDQNFYGFAGGSWEQFSVAGGVTSFSAGNTGLTPSTPTSGAVVLGGTLDVDNGGTGAANAGDARTNLDVPSRSGSGATGTWNIDISGNAATATTSTNVSGGLANQIIYNSGPGTTTFVVAPSVANSFLEWSGSVFQWSANPLGTVTSVGLSLPSEFSVSGSPVTTSGTLTGAWASQTQNYIFAAPNGSPGAPSFRAMVAADVPTLNQNTTGQAGSVANSVTFNSTGGDAPNTSFNGSAARTVDYSTVGAPKIDGTGATGTWGIGISGNAATATSATTSTNLAGGAANQIVYQTGSGATSFITGPTIANTFLEWSGSAFQWSANPLGTVTSVDVSGGTTGLTFSGGPVTTSGTITMAGTLAIANGGTNATATPTAGAVAYGTGTAYAFTSAGSSGQVLTSAGVGTPAWTTATSANTASAIVQRDGSGNFSAGTITATLSGNASTATTATNIAGGGTGSLPYNSASGTTTFLNLGTSGYVLTAGASAPQYVAQSTLAVGSATNATNSTNIGITDDASTNATMYPVWVTANTGNLPAKVTSTKLSFNPSTGALTVTGAGFSGALNGTVGATTPNTGSFTTMTASADSSFTSTGAVQLSSGTTAQRPTGAAGKLRFNTTTTEFEGYNGAAWSSVGGSAITNDTTTATNVYPAFLAATSGTASSIYTSNSKLLYKPSTGELASTVLNATNGLVVNSQTVSTSYTVATGNSAMSAGPITISGGVSVTLSGTARWVVS
jgi:hypothetical protein